MKHSLPFMVCTFRNSHFQMYSTMSQNFYYNDILILLKVSPAGLTSQKTLNDTNANHSCRISPILHYQILHYYLLNSERASRRCPVTPVDSYWLECNDLIKEWGVTVKNATILYTILNSNLTHNLHGDHNLLLSPALNQLLGLIQTLIRE